MTAYQRPKRNLNVTLTPYVYYDYLTHKPELRIIEKGYEYPDPSKVLLWGRDKNGEVRPGDFKGNFKKIGKPLHFKIEVEDTYWAAMMEQKVKKIKKIIKSHKWPKVE
jgi:hypothetical protein